jgi:hypothetical protein
MLLVDGEALVQAPQTSVHIDDLEFPGPIVQRHRHFEALLEKARPLPPLVTAVVCPEDVNFLGGAILAAQQGIITPVLDKVSGVRAGRHFTHVFVMDVPGMSHPLLVTDAAINIAPDLATKIDIVQNAIDLAISIGIDPPRAGVLSAVETVNPAIQSSIDVALLSKMAERGQIKNGLVDGPLAMDNAVSLAAPGAHGGGDRRMKKALLTINAGSSSRSYSDMGIRRYGFHRLSYEYIAGEIACATPWLAKGNVIVAHLGNCASVCAIHNSKSVASAMGFSALDGLPMGTRCGQIDPSVLLYLMDQEKLSAAEISDLLYRQSGLLSTSGISNDMRVLEASGSHRAAEAIDYFVFRVQREIGAMAEVCVSMR